jgi:cell shape-determining protein MreD
MNFLSPIVLLMVAYLGIYAQASFDLPRSLIGAQINLLPALIVYASLAEDIFTVALISVAGGFLFDSLSASPLGTSILPLFLPGYLIFCRRKLLLRENTYAQFVLGIMTGAAVPLMTIFLLFTLNQKPLLGWSSLWQWFVLAISSGLLAPACFAFFNRLNRALSYQRVAETSFRSDREIKRDRFVR